VEIKIWLYWDNHKRTAITAFPNRLKLLAPEITSGCEGGQHLVPESAFSETLSREGRKQKL
jgi:hypothetical protein